MSPASTPTGASMTTRATAAVRTYVARPVEVEAIEFVGGKENVQQISAWMRRSYANTPDASCEHDGIPLDEVARGWVFVTKGQAQGPQAWNYIKDGQSWQQDVVAAVYDAVIHHCWLPLRVGQFIVRGPKGEFYPIDAEVLEMKYEVTL